MILIYYARTARANLVLPDESMDESADNTVDARVHSLAADSTE
jgi:hypothetical protein